MKTGLIALALCAGAASSAFADFTVSLQPGALPTAQPGWTYGTSGLHTGTPESTAFATTGTRLDMSTMGRGLAATSAHLGARHFIPESAITNTSRVHIGLRARVLASEVDQYHHGFGVSVQGGDYWLGFGLSTTHVQFTNIPAVPAMPASFDTTQWHDYDIFGDWTTGQFHFFVDSQLVAQGPMGWAHMAPNVFIGDATGTANASVQIEEFAMTVPSPAGLAVLAPLGLIAARRRRTALCSFDLS
ncbi:MAG TPA: hypothetical protein VD971_03890 [Phycisphaerales bacterium]|nr:hypothetical protein [Phycisphaerales bacterium]